MTNIVDYVTKCVYDVIDSDETLRNEIMSEVEALSDYDVCQAGADGHEDCDYDAPCRTLEDWPTLRDVGDVIATWLRDHADEFITMNALRTIFIDLLDLERVTMIEEFGRWYYPDDALARLTAAGIVD